MNALVLVLLVHPSTSLKYHDKVIVGGKQYKVTAHRTDSSCRKGLYTLKQKSNSFIYVCGEYLTKEKK